MGRRRQRERQERRYRRRQFLYHLGVQLIKMQEAERNFLGKHTEVHLENLWQSWEYVVSLIQTIRMNGGLLVEAQYLMNFAAHMEETA